MADKKNNAVRIVLKNVPLNYAKLGEPVLNDQTKKYENSVQVRYDRDDSEIDELVRSAAKKAFINKFGEDKEKWPTKFKRDKFFETYLSEDGQDGFFLRDGDATGKDDMKGKNFFTVRTSHEEKSKVHRPTCGKRLGDDKWVELKGDRIEEELYSGCFADVIADVVAYDNVKKGVSIYLKGVLKTGDGERIGGGEPVNMSEMFGLTQADPEELDAGNSDDELDV